MTLDDGRLRFLVKGHQPAARFRLKLDASRSGIALTSQPLFRSIGSTGRRGAAAASSKWFLVTTEPNVDGNPWDICHKLANREDGGIEFVEPDLVQRWPRPRGPSSEGAFAMREGPPHRQNETDFPAVAGDDLWFRDAQHGQFASALEDLPDPGEGRRTRVAHLDSGYDPDHHTRPVHLSLSEQRNFVDADAPNDARDRSSGLFNAFSHGTGTLCILAGAPVERGKGFGCAPYAEVIPIRVADSVVLFRNSAIAQAFDYVHGLCRNPSTRVHVVTMSMGGMPSRAWAEAVNALYERGRLRGDSRRQQLRQRADASRCLSGALQPGRGGLRRDVQRATLCRPESRLMAGNYGPETRWQTSIAAYTPMCRGHVSASRTSSISRARARRPQRRKSPARRRCGFKSTAAPMTPIESHGCGSRRCARRCSITLARTRHARGTLAPASFAPRMHWTPSPPVRRRSASTARRCQPGNLEDPVRPERQRIAAAPCHA